MNVIISYPERVENIKEKIRNDGPESLHVLADFDRTLTYAAVNGVKTSSIISLLRDGNHLTQGYAEKAHALFNTYHPIELDPSIPVEEKKKTMEIWWETHNRLLIKSGLSYADLEDIVGNGHVKFREGVSEFLDFLHTYQIPLIIFSASGCGEAVRMFFQKIQKDYPNIFYVTNQFNWDENGRAISTKGVIIHSFNKDETLLEEIPEVYKAIQLRSNVILLGDSMGDVGMIEGFAYHALLKVGFLNSDTGVLKKEYENNFDIILEGDGDFSYVNKLMKDIVSAQNISPPSLIIRN